MSRRTLLRDYGFATGIQASLDSLFGWGNGYRRVIARISKQTVGSALATDIKNVEEDMASVFAGPEVMQEVAGLSDQHIVDRLPSSSWLKAYREIDPSFPGRVLSITEAESEHRRFLQKRIIRQQFWLSVWMNICALLAIGLVTALCWFMVYKAFPTQAATVGGTVIVALAAIFIRKKSG